MLAGKPTFAPALAETLSVKLALAAPAALATCGALRALPALLTLTTPGSRALCGRTRRPKATRCSSELRDARPLLQSGRVEQDALEGLATTCTAMRGPPHGTALATEAVVGAGAALEARAHQRACAASTAGDASVRSVEDGPRGDLLRKVVQDLEKPRILHGVEGLEKRSLALKGQRVQRLQQLQERLPRGEVRRGRATRARERGVHEARAELRQAAAAMLEAGGARGRAEEAPQGGLEDGRRSTQLAAGPARVPSDHGSDLRQVGHRDHRQGLVGQAPRGSEVRQEPQQRLRSEAGRIAGRLLPGASAAAGGVAGIAVRGHVGILARLHLTLQARGGGVVDGGPCEELQLENRAAPAAPLAPRKVNKVRERCGAQRAQVALVVGVLGNAVPELRPDRADAFEHVRVLDRAGGQARAADLAPASKLEHQRHPRRL
mmetsp:Transcript_16910/g.53105  ORF Transcript_16910/g.53105 Transcript_16910/m.53105 type:complete len:435 (-) Transcript_16910:72-1376(-)